MTPSPFKTMLLGGLLLACSATYSQLDNCQNDGNGSFIITVDTIATNIGPITNILGTTTDLTGFNTYRLFLTCEDSTDLLQAVFGDAENPTSINTSTSFYQTPEGSSFSHGISPALLPVYPELGFDSWLTIGMEGPADSDDGEIEIAVVEGNADFPISGAFAAGNNLNLNSLTGSSWYVTEAQNATNCRAGADLRILFAQLTTDGIIDGNVHFQVFKNENVEGIDCLRPFLSIPNNFNGGCLDSTACNFDALATFDNGTCDYCSCSETETTILQSASFPNDSLPDYSLEVDLIASHDTTDLPSLFGMNTYRLYVRTAAADEKVTAVFGDASIPLDIQTTTGFFHSPLGGVTPNTVYPVLFPFFPELEYDSWVTIGIDKTAGLYGTGYGDINAISDPNTPSWMSIFDPGAGIPGGNIFANSQVGGLWYTLTNNLNTIPDEDNRVLIAQFTTDGIISGSLGAQILPPGLSTDNNEYYKLRFDFTTEGLGEIIDLPNPLCPCDTLPDLDGDGVCDAVDPCVGYYDFCGVCNGPGPIYECGCVEFPVGACDCAGNVYDVIGVCGGSCEADIDGDGVCDTDEVFGCTDPAACNFSSMNTEEDGSCVYLDAVGVCGGDCAADTDGNGICDTVDALHCGPGTHWDGETGQCVISCPSDINLDGAVAIADLLALLSDFANFCEDLD